MKLVHKSLEKDSGGSVTIIPENADDMWDAYNIIAEGDAVRATTIRKVVMESATGSTDSSRVKTTLTIRVEQMDFDAAACVVRVKGRNIEENPHVKMGAYHTHSLELNRKFTITKECWDLLFLDRLDKACDPTQSAEVAAVVMQEGIAHVCLVGSSMTLLRAKIDMNIPKKRKGHCSQHEKGLQKFYDTIIQAIIRHVNFEVVKCVIIASPGWVKDHFFEYMMQQAVKTDNKVLLENKGKFFLVHASSGFKHSLREVLENPQIQSKISDTKAASEVRALEQFYQMLQNEPAKAFYGVKHIERAAEVQAIETLLISDKLFKNADVNQRKKFVALVESIQEAGGEVKIFSTLHVSGEQLEQLTGIAAILRFPMPELEDEALSDESDSD